MVAPKRFICVGGPLNRQIIPYSGTRFKCKGLTYTYALLERKYEIYTLPFVIVHRCLAEWKPDMVMCVGGPQHGTYLKPYDSIIQFQEQPSFSLWKDLNPRVFDKPKTHKYSLVVITQEEFTTRFYEYEGIDLTLELLTRFINHDPNRKS